MQATRLEFEQRFWVIGAIFFMGFACGWIDHTPATVTLIHTLFPGLDIHSDRATSLIRGVFFVAAGLVLVAATLRTWATAYLGSHIVHDQALRSESVVPDGPYRFVRNPLYLAVIMMAAGIAFMTSVIGWAVIVLGMTLFLYRLILREEAGLLAAHGESYRAYMSRVPRLFPLPWARIPAGTTRPRWGQAFIGELFFWLLAAGSLLFAITLNAGLAGIVMAASLVVYFIAAGIAKKAAARHAAAAPTSRP